MNRTVARALAFDVVAILVFVAIGRRSHDETGNVVVQTLKVAAPFLLGLAAGWAAAQAWRRPEALRTGAIVWVTTIVVGMVLRHWVFDRGTAVSFIIVATLFTGLFLMGWRAITGVVQRRSNAPS
jgi:hypothetical protein